MKTYWCSKNADFFILCASIWCFFCNSCYIKSETLMWCDFKFLQKGRAAYVWLKKDTDRYLTKYTPISPKIYYDNDGPSTSYTLPTKPVSHGIKASPKSSFKKKLTSLGFFFKESTKNKVFPAAPSNINKQLVTILNHLKLHLQLATNLEQYF